MKKLWLQLGWKPSSHLGVWCPILSLSRGLLRDRPSLSLHIFPLHLPFSSHQLSERSFINQLLSVLLPLVIALTGRGYWMHNGWKNAIQNTVKFHFSPKNHLFCFVFCFVLLWVWFGFGVAFFFLSPPGCLSKPSQVLFRTVWRVKSWSCRQHLPYFSPNSHCFPS